MWGGVWGGVPGWQGCLLPNLPNPLGEPDSLPPDPDPGHRKPSGWAGGAPGTAHSWEELPALASALPPVQPPGACASRPPQHSPCPSPPRWTHGSEDTEPEAWALPGGPGRAGPRRLEPLRGGRGGRGQGPCPGVTCGSGHLLGRGQTCRRLPAQQACSPILAKWGAGGSAGVRRA